jgi:hypothetical protein
MLPYIPKGNAVKVAGSEVPTLAERENPTQRQPRPKPAARELVASLPFPEPVSPHGTWAAIFPHCRYCGFQKDSPLSRSSSIVPETQNFTVISSRTGRTPWPQQDNCVGMGRQVAESYISVTGRGLGSHILSMCNVTM